jgi:serine/threonine protein phosphatase PrpC
MLEVAHAQLSDPGRVRDHNEDALGCALPQSPQEARRQGWLYVLADGVGGHERGEVASAMAVTGITADFRAQMSAQTGIEALSAVLSRLVQAANLKIYEEAMRLNAGGKSMATTVVACALRFNQAAIAHVGDSRCYLIRKGKAKQLTRDHTLAGEYVRMGLAAGSQAASQSGSHVLSRAVGSQMFVQVDVSELQIFAGDVLLLCSDGMHHSVSGEEMAEAVGAGQDTEGAAQRLVALARERDGSDNISVQIVHVRSVERVGIFRGRHYKIR